MDSETRTTCPYCGVGCGIVARRRKDGTVDIRGDESHPANYGRICSKGFALGETLDLEGRLLHPMVGSERRDWNTALDAVASGFTRILRDHGPEAVAFYVSGQLLTEEYYVANKLMKGFIGAANIDTNSRLCMASSVAGYRRAFGSDAVPVAYEDFERADLVLFIGSNAAWCHPVLYERLVATKVRKPDLKIVTVDPRRTHTCEAADLHLPLKPGTDAILFNGLLAYLHSRGRVDRTFVDDHTEGMEDAVRAAKETAPSIASVAADCGLDGGAVESFFRLFAETERVLSVYSQGVNQSSSGTDKVTAILNCHLLTGRIGKPGMGPFSVTGQPNAMGGREVGGLANQLAAHMDLENPEHRDRVRRFWNAPEIATTPGLRAVDLFRAMAEGKVRAVWIMATNPAVSLPDADRVREALRACEFVVVSEVVRHTDTADCAHILLPALAWGEKEGTVTNSERRISRQRAFLPPPGEAKPDWWIVCEVAKRMGFADAFDYRTPVEIFREHAALSGFENDRERFFDISALSGIDETGYRDLTPLQWPVIPNHPGGTKRLFTDGVFGTVNGKARFVAVTPRPPRNATSERYPLVLNTGRARDHWHTMTRTGKSPRLSAHRIEPYAEVHPADAARIGVRDGALVRVESAWGWMNARAMVSEDQREGSVFVPFHWNDRYAKRGRVGALVNPELDAISGQPESKHTPVRVLPQSVHWYGFALSRQPLRTESLDHWVRVAGDGFWRYEIGGDRPVADWVEWAGALLEAETGVPDWLAYRDAATGRYRFARLAGGRLENCLFVAPDPALPSRVRLAGFFQKDRLSATDRANLLSGQAGSAAADAGRLVCSCSRIDEGWIREAIRTEGLATLDAVGRVLDAGTKCGSCRPELTRILAEVLAGCRETGSTSEPTAGPERAVAVRAG